MQLNGSGEVSEGNAEALCILVRILCVDGTNESRPKSGKAE